MDYVSTRNKERKVSAAYAIANGIAPDGGLYCREAIYAIQPDVLSGCTPVLYGSVDGAAIQGGWRVTFQLDG